MHFSSPLALVAAAFALGVMAVGETSSGQGGADPNAATTDPTTPQAGKEEPKLDTKAKALCDKHCPDLGLQDMRDACMKQCIAFYDPLFRQLA
ncbi:hypothetical protein O0I10_011760 [Lichtheimia ornata]|uniref:Uncharacterized protein n=1 Tax=Lichtheimia ornata TaxID=688661 RepID=A0AAD7US81_9FUNG|nr:uncharacterized protein O0I10_011760 [Lichtheimia ornata]KAJ8652614.1 hypothetical protein O0I10_011760 [Lichtheimia ornata]